MFVSQTRRPMFENKNSRSLIVNKLNEDYRPNGGGKISPHNRSQRLFTENS